MVSPVPVAEGIYCREGAVPTPYFVRGEYAAIVDPGPASSVPSVLQALGQLGWDKDKVRYIIPTHIHLDHGGGAGSLAQELPQAQVVVYHQAARHLLDPSRLVEGTRLAFGPDFEQRFGPILPVPEARLLAVADGARLDLGGRELAIYHTPGHANHHISIFDLKAGALFCGEALGSYFPENEAVRPAVALPMFEVDVALETIEKLERLKPKLLLFAQHGVSRHPQRLFPLAKKAVEDYSKVVLEALSEGLRGDEISQRLVAFERAVSEQQGHQPAPDLQARDYWQTVAGLTAYFRSKKLV